MPTQNFMLCRIDDRRSINVQSAVSKRLISHSLVSFIASKIW